jgi:hypothetical protein
MRQLDLVVAAIWVGLGVAVAIGATRLGVMGPGGPGSGLFPLLAGLALALAGLVQMLLRDTAGVQRAFFAESGAAPRVLAVIATLAAMIALAPRLGVLLPGAVGLAVLVHLLAPRARWWTGSAVGVVSAALCWLVFVRALGTPLPRGPFGF